MAWQWAETLVEIRGTLEDIKGTTKYGIRCHFPKHEFNRPVCLEAYHYLLPISLLNVLICTQGMQRTWWPEAGTIIVTGPFCLEGT